MSPMYRIMKIIGIRNNKKDTETGESCKRTPAPRNMYDLNETWSNKQNIQYLYVQIQGRQKASQ